MIDSRNSLGRMAANAVFMTAQNFPLLQDYAVGEFKENPLSHIMFDCLMDPHHLLPVLGKNFSSVLQ